MTTLDFASATQLPSPKTIPLIGNVPDLMKGDGGCIYDAVCKINRDFNGPFSLTLGPQTWVISSDLDIMKEVLSDSSGRFPKGETLTELRAIGIGEDGLVEVEGEQWLRQRRLSLPAFKKNYLNNMARHIEEKTVLLLKLLGKSDEVELLDIMSRTALAIICQAGFGYESRCLDSLDSPDPVLYTNHFGAQELMKRMSRTPLWKYLPTPSNIKLKRLINEQKAFFTRIINQRRNEPQANNDLLDIFLNAEDEEGNRFTEKELVDQLQNFIGAAFESVGTTLHWFFYYMARHPEIEQRIVDELVEVLGDRDVPQPDDLEKLTYLNRVVKEVLRLRPAFPVVLRQASDDCVLGGYQIKAKSFVLSLIAEVHRNPQFWGHEPERFNPDHFLPEAEAQRPNYAFAPFGIGPRKCIGERMAIMEAMIIGGAVLKKFHMVLNQRHTVLPYMKFSWMSKYDIKMRPIPRTPGRPLPAMPRPLGILEKNVSVMNSCSPGSGNLVVAATVPSAVTSKQLESIAPYLVQKIPTLIANFHSKVDMNNQAEHSISEESVSSGEEFEASKSRIIDNALGTDFINGSYSFALHIVRHKETSWICLAQTHAGSDGQTVVYALQTILGLLDNSRNEKLDPLQNTHQMPISEPLERDIPFSLRGWRGWLPMLKGMIEALSWQRKANSGLCLKLESPAPMELRRPVHAQIDIPSEISDQLMNLTETKKVSWYALIGTTLLKAIAEHSSKTNSKFSTPDNTTVSLPMVLTTDMRRRCEPPRSPSEAGYLSSGILVHSNISVNTTSKNALLNSAELLQQSTKVKLARGESWVAIRLMQLMGETGLRKHLVKSAEQPCYVPLYLGDAGYAEISDGTVCSSLQLLGQHVFAMSLRHKSGASISLTAPSPLVSQETLNTIASRTYELLNTISS